MSHSYGNQPQAYPAQGPPPSSQYYYPVPQHPSMRVSNPSAAVPPRPSTYPQPGNSPPDGERASKRRRPTSMDHSAQTQAQWAAQQAAQHYAQAGQVHHQTLHAAGHAHARRSPSSTSHSRRSSNEPEEGEDVKRFDHGPTELPPRTYTGQSKYNPPKKPGKIPGSAMDYLPILEARFDRLETAIDRYVDYRGQRALSNSILPGQEGSSSSSSRR